MSIDGVIDDPDIVVEAEPYFSSSEEQDYQERWLSSADALLLGRKTYENFSQAYLQMADEGKGAPMDFVNRMNSIPKYVASKTLSEASWNATVIQGDISDEVRKIKKQSGKNIIKYGTGPLDQILMRDKLVDVLCVVIYPFVLGHGTHLLEGLGVTEHWQLSNVKHFASGTVVLELVPKT